MFTIYDLRDIIQTAFWGGMLVLILIGWGILKANQARMRFYVAWLIIVPAGFLALVLPSPKEYKAAKERKQRYETGKAIFAERCKNAGEKIYKTVDNVEGVLLLKIPNSNINSDGKNPMWANAALRSETDNGAFINEFFQYKAVPKNNQFLIKLSNKLLLNDDDYIYYKGYNFIDVKKENGRIIRYTGLLNDDFYYMKSEPTLQPNQVARYAISYETNINKEERKYWVAGVTIQIIDTKKNEIIAEKIQYVFDEKQGNTDNGRVPWLYAITCPSSRENKIRFFIDKVLKPN